MNPYHKPVLLNEIVEFSRSIQPSLIFDGTLGDGGHSLALLQAFNQANLIATDRDPEMLARAKERLIEYENRIQLKRCNFSEIFDKDRFDTELKFDFVILDLGIASYHLDDANRGFSFQDNTELDMRLDKEGAKALDLVNGLSEKELADILFLYGEERKARAIAGMIVKRRKWTNASDLAQAIMNLMYAKRQNRAPNKKGSTMKSRGNRNIHPATRTFQALRIAVNRELEHLENFLEKITKHMKEKGIVTIISFHSLEDRLVKWYMKYWADPMNIPMDVPIKQLREKRLEPLKLPLESLGKILTKKPIIPTDEEMRSNPRARSAKLRAFQFSSDIY